MAPPAPVGAGGGWIGGWWVVLFGVGDWLQRWARFVRPTAGFAGDLARPPCALAEECGECRDVQRGNHERGERDSNGHPEAQLPGRVVVVDHERAERGGQHQSGGRDRWGGVAVAAATACRGVASEANSSRRRSDISML